VCIAKNKKSIKELAERIREERGEEKRYGRCEKKITPKTTIHQAERVRMVATCSETPPQNAIRLTKINQKRAGPRNNGEDK
jgi:hypothetical protein